MNLKFILKKKKIIKKKYSKRKINLKIKIKKNKNKSIKNQKNQKIIRKIKIKTKT
jgi:hypothetical protein